MRSNYDEAELLALTETLALISTEYQRQIDIITAYLRHLPTCEEPTHRATIAKRAADAVTGLITMIRYAGWIEAEVTTTRVFPAPAKILAEFREAQDSVIAEIKRRKEAVEVQTVGTPAPVPTPVVQETPAFTEREQEPGWTQAPESMDKLATAPFPTTKQ